MPPARSAIVSSGLALLAAACLAATPAFADDAVTDDDWQDGVSLRDVPTGGVADPGDDGPGRKVPAYVGMCEAADGCDLTEEDGALGSKGKHATGVAVAAGATDQAALSSDAPAADPAPATAADPAPAAPAPADTVADTTVRTKGTGDDRRVVVSDADDSAILSCTDDASHAAICGTAAAGLTAAAVAYAILRNGRNADGTLRPNVLQRQRMRYIDEVFSVEDATGAELSKAMQYARELAGQGLKFSSFPRSFQGYLLDDPTWVEHDRAFVDVGFIGIPEGAHPDVVDSAEKAWLTVLREANADGERGWGRAQDLAADLAADGFALPEAFQTWADAHPVSAEARGNVNWKRPDPDDTGSDGFSDYDPNDRWPSIDEDDFDIPRDRNEHRGEDYDGGRINRQDPRADGAHGGNEHGGRAGRPDEDPHRRADENEHRRGEHVERRSLPHRAAHPVFHGF